MSKTQFMKEAIRKCEANVSVLTSACKVQPLPEHISLLGSNPKT